MSTGNLSWRGCSDVEADEGFSEGSVSFVVCLAWMCSLGGGVKTSTEVERNKYVVVELEFKPRSGA